MPHKVMIVIIRQIKNNINHWLLVVRLSNYNKPGGISLDSRRVLTSV